MALAVTTYGIHINEDEPQDLSAAPRLPLDGNQFYLTSTKRNHFVSTVNALEVNKDQLDCTNLI